MPVLCGHAASLPGRGATGGQGASAETPGALPRPARPPPGSPCLLSHCAPPGDTRSVATKITAVRSAPLLRPRGPCHPQDDFQDSYSVVPTGRRSRPTRPPCLLTPPVCTSRSLAVSRVRGALSPFQAPLWALLPHPGQPAPPLNLVRLWCPVALAHLPPPPGSLPGPLQSPV